MGAIGLGLGIAGSVASASKAKKARKEVESQSEIYEKQKAEQQELFEKQYYQDVTKRSEVQGILKSLDKQQEEQKQRDVTQAAITGSTEEAQTAQQDSYNKHRADILSQVAQNASAYRDGLLNDWRNRLDTYYGQQVAQSDKIAAIEQNMSQQWANMANNAYQFGGKSLGYGIGQKFEQKA